ncbi:MAG: Lrp/AsnC family transcriptional regulator [Ktedonobacteraceae bacterium]|nr:Lrp/AsnC family transcriptional regulator [Ktedonobacteraceae bacterium]
MDTIDRAIVSLLHIDGHLTQEQIAGRVNLSRPAVHERIKRLEERGIIRGYQARVDWSALGFPVTAFIWVSTVGAACTETGREIMALSDVESLVEECYRVTGEWCFLIKARLISPLALQNLLDRIRNVPDVHRTTTTMALSALSEEGQSAIRSPWTS